MKILQYLMSGSFAVESFNSVANVPIGVVIKGHSAADGTITDATSYFIINF